MVSVVKCDCQERIGIVINSIKEFEILKIFFESQVLNNVFEELEVKSPYYSYTDCNEHIEWFATKWYRCKNCGCLWEFNYPDFPAKGFVRKFSNGIYKPREVLNKNLKER